MSVPTVRTLLFVWLTAANLMSFLQFAWDKDCARKHKKRIPESSLLLVTALGGSIGAMLGMIIFHHKTRKAKFFIGVPVFFLVQAALLVLLSMGL